MAILYAYIETQNPDINKGIGDRSGALRDVCRW